MKKFKAGKRFTPPTSLQFIMRSYEAYKRSKRAHRTYLNEVALLVLGSTPPASRWSTLIARDIYVTLLAAESGGSANLSIPLRQAYLKAKGKIPYSADDLLSMKLAEMSYTDLVIPIVAPPINEGARKVSKAENEFAIDKGSIPGWADWCGSNEVSLKGFKAILETGVGIKQADKDRAIGIFNSAKKYLPEVHDKSDTIPAGIQEILRIGLEADSSQVKLAKILKLPVNVAEAEKAAKKAAKLAPKHAPLIPKKASKVAEPVKVKAKASKKAEAPEPVKAVPVKKAVAKKKVVPVKKSK